MNIMTTPFEEMAGLVLTPELRRAGIVHGGCSDACMPLISATVVKRSPTEITVRHGEATQTLEVTDEVWTNYQLRETLVDYPFAEWVREIHGAPKPLFVGTGRPVVWVWKHGLVKIADDLTMTEAKDVIARLATGAA